MFQPLLTTHKIVVSLFLVIYLVKTILLLSKKSEVLSRFTKIVRIPEMIISLLFLVTGIALAMQIPSVDTMLIIKIIMVLASIPLAVIGFKKNKQVLALVSFVLIVLSYGLGEMSKKKMMHTTVVEADKNSTDAKILYADYCAKCHGEDGKLGKVGAKDLTLSTLDSVGILEVLHRGRKNMPAFENVLTEEQINEIAKYTQTFRH